GELHHWLGVSRQGRLQCVASRALLYSPFPLLTMWQSVAIRQSFRGHQFCQVSQSPCGALPVGLNAHTGKGRKSAPSLTGNCTPVRFVPNQVWERDNEFHRALPICTSPSAAPVSHRHLCQSAVAGKVALYISYRQFAPVLP